MNRKRRGVGTPTTSVVLTGAGKRHSTPLSSLHVSRQRAQSVMRVSTCLRSSHGGVAVSNTDDRRFDSFRACSAPDRQSGHQHIDNCRVVVGTSAPGPEMGRSRHGVHLFVRQPSIRHRGFDSLPAHTRASRRTGQAAVAQPVVAPARQAGGRGCKSRRWRRRRSKKHVDVAEWTRRRSTKPEDAGSTPAVGTALAVAQWIRAPRSERGGRPFESGRRG